MLKIIKTNTTAADGSVETKVSYQLEKPEWGWFILGMVAGFICYPVWSFFRAAMSYY